MPKLYDIESESHKGYKSSNFTELSFHTNKYVHSKMHYTSPSAGQFWRCFRKIFSLSHVKMRFQDLELYFGGSLFLSFIFVAPNM